MINKGVPDDAEEGIKDKNVSVKCTCYYSFAILHTSLIPLSVSSSIRFQRASGVF